MRDLALSLQGTPIQARDVPTGGLSSLANIIQTVLALAFFFAILLFLIIMVWSGFQWMFSAGDKQKLQQSKQRITYAIVGLVLVFVSILIINVLGAFFGVSLLNIPGT
jgi:hypothetical protein